MEWTPEKLAVYITRCLDSRDDSLLKGHIKVTALDGKLVSSADSSCKEKWVVSTATIVEGILNLITENAKADRDRMFSRKIFRVSRQDVEHYEKATVPLRGFYMSGKSDEVIYNIVRNVFCASEHLFNKSGRNYLLFHKTVGVKAIFLVLRELVSVAINSGDVSTAMWMKLMQSQQKIVRFSDPYLFGSSGTHVGRVRDMLLIMAGNKKIDDFKEKACYAEYVRLWKEAEEV